MKMGSLSLASILANGCRSPSSRVALLRTLATTHAALSKHYNKNLVACSSGCSQSKLSACESSSPDVTHNAPVEGYPDYHRLLPCPSQNGPPRVEHLVVSEGGPVLEFICKVLDLPPLFVADLIHFGAVYYALVCPQPPPSATPEQIRTFEEVTAPSVLRKRASIRGKTVREAQKTFRVTRVDQFIEAGTYLRVHVHPKRFPRCYEIDWKSRIIAVAESYVVLDKPAGTSVGGTTDNIEESCATFATRALGLTTPLMTTHQIDNCTEGCVVLARTKEYCSVFHGKIREKKVKKLYLALAAAPVPIGIITHYMRPLNMAPRLISEDFIKGWYLCLLEVLECKEVPWPNDVIENKYCIEDCGWPSKHIAYECKINLLTGRTHQIRAQLAAHGAPLVGDSMYMPAAIAEMTSPGLNPFGKCKKDYTSETDKSMAVTEWVAQHGKEPKVTIGLQASQISWDGGEHMYEARSPWWRCEIA
ncbi:RNA pseudouridine synthase 6, chloroplastic [Alnus glutinosa]|uniref:RNA pseudouridine synthase 6, chloroplastic n=1 Tax=Alnus glutinosa TaxID=3517 RepID=UPI002D7862DA|nr:RNA pseudouridine synthase 6, chloroplastic [Alnus glutinosa]XP_062161437.1 RNA pseudouridine synthase 6, chloroplastic [Alnus glutinosa]